MRRANTGYQDGNYGLPAGHLEDNESLTEGLKREVKEEIGIDVGLEDFKLVEVIHRRENDIRLDFFFTVKKFSGEVINAKHFKKCVVSCITDGIDIVCSQTFLDTDETLAFRMVFAQKIGY